MDVLIELACHDERIGAYRDISGNVADILLRRTRNTAQPAKLPTFHATFVDLQHKFCSHILFLPPTHTSNPDTIICSYF